MQFSLNGKIALVTGGGSGIGKAIALLFARQGANVFVFDTDEHATQTISAETAAGQLSVKTMICDVSDQQQVMQEVDRLVNETGGINILVNNAGVAHIGNVETTDEADFDRLFRINVKGVYNCLKAVVPHMKARGGVILNMASVAATMGIPDRFAYSMTKGAVVSMTLATARDYVSQGIRCNCMSPGRVHTPFVDGFISKNYPGQEEEVFRKLSASQPIGRMAEPDEIAALALYLCSDEASFVTGCDYPVDGGFTKLNT